MDRRAAPHALTLLVLLAGCHEDTGFLMSKFACADGSDCLDGYTCHPGLLVCVAAETLVAKDVPNDRVSVNDGVKTFLIDRTEVRVAHYAQCVLRGPCAAPNCTSFSEDAPIHCVSYDDARNYCAWAGGRLPTGPEWVFAALGATGRIFPWGNDPPSCRYAVVDDQGPGCGTNRPLEVGSKTEGQSPFGVHDMIGNVWEWVDELAGNQRVTKGGSYLDAPSSDLINPANPRLVLEDASFRHPSVGFRCAADVN